MHTTRHNTSAMALAIIISTITAQAAIIDWNSDPDGTLASAGNPYNGDVTITASGTANTSFGPDTVEGSVVNNELTVVHPGVILHPSDVQSFSSTFLAVFSNPVDYLSFQTTTSRPGIWTVTMNNGTSDEVVTGVTSFENRVPTVHEVLPISGYWITQLHIRNRDFASSDDSGIWVDDIIYTVVPEPGTLIAGFLLLFPFGAQAFRTYFRRA